VGVDLFVYNPPGDPNEVGKRMETLNGGGMKLVMVSNRGVKVYPDGLPDTITTTTGAAAIKAIMRIRRSPPSR